MLLDIPFRQPSNGKSLLFPYAASPPAADMRVPSPAMSRPNSPTVSTKGIPDSLSFDKIIQGGTCPPMTCRDFMHYLIYVEHSAENLQFYLWLLDYTARFKSLSPNDRVLSTEVVPLAYASAESANSGSISGSNSITDSKVVTRFFADKFQAPSVQLSVPAPTKDNPFRTPPETPMSAHAPSYSFGKPSGSGSGSGSGDGSECGNGNGMIAPFLSETTTLRGVDHATVAADAFQAVGMRWQPFTIQPFREEISRIIAIYIAEGSPRELNASARDRTAALRALAQTTHPSALEPLRKTVEDSLRFQAHPNFVRWSIRNGNGHRVMFAVGMGIGAITVGFLIAVLLTLSGGARAWRALAAVAWLVGVATLIAGGKGMCVILHGLHRRHVRPWELWEDEANPEAGHQKMSFESGSGFNSYEDEPWVEKYAGLSVIRKIFGREVWIEEPALRRLQDQIFWQSLLVAFVTSAGLAGAFIALPKGGLM